MSTIREKFQWINEFDDKILTLPPVAKSCIEIVRVNKVRAIYLNS